MEKAPKGLSQHYGGPLQDVQRLQSAWHRADDLPEGAAMTDADPILPLNGPLELIDRAEAHLLRRGRWLGQFLVYYQPIIAVADGSLTGMEALLRW